MASCRRLLLLFALFGLATANQASSLGVYSHDEGADRQPRAAMSQRSWRQGGGRKLLEDINTKPAKAPNPKEALAQVRIMRRADSSSSSGSSGGAVAVAAALEAPSLPAEDEGSDGSGGSSGSSEEVSEVVEAIVESSSASPKSARRSKYDVVYDPDDQSTWTLDGSSTVLSFGGSVPASEVLSSLSSRRRRLMQANGNADLANSAYFTTLASELADALNIFPEWVIFDNIRLDGDEVLYDVQVLLPAGLPQDDIDSIQNSLANPESLNLSVPLRVTTPIATGTIDDTELFPVPNDEDPPVPPEVPVPTVSSPADAPTPTETGVPEEPTQTTRPVSPPSTPVQPPSVTQTPDVAPAPIATPTTPQNVGELNVDDEPNDATPPPPPGGGGLSTGAVIAIVAVVAVLLGVSIGLFSYFSYRKKKGAATTGTWTANPASETSRGVITPAVASTATTPRDPRATPRHVLKYKSTSAPTSAAKTPTPAGAPDEEPLKQTAVLKPTAGTISGAEFEAPSPMMTKSPEYDGLKSFLSIATAFSTYPRRSRVAQGTGTLLHPEPPQVGFERSADDTREQVMGGTSPPLFKRATDRLVLSSVQRG